MIYDIPAFNPQIKPIIVIERKVEPPKEPTLDQKIASNYYKCTALEWIRADNAQCLDKVPVAVESPSEPIKKTSQPTSTAGNTYTAGYCTWYVKNQRRDIPNGLGNANMWANNAVGYGLTVSSTPTVGAVAVARNYTHVAIVTGVHGLTVTVMEMNFVGWNRVSSREAPISEFRYIY